MAARKHISHLFYLRAAHAAYTLLRAYAAASYKNLFTPIRHSILNQPDRCRNVFVHGQSFTEAALYTLIPSPLNLRLYRKSFASNSTVLLSYDFIAIHIFVYEYRNMYAYLLIFRLIDTFRYKIHNYKFIFIILLYLFIIKNFCQL